jgi:hypothetical protein
MDGKRHVKNVLISDKLNQKVFIEGDLGKIVNIEIVEKILLEIQGTNGILRVDLPEGELRKALLKEPSS